MRGLVAAALIAAAIPAAGQTADSSPSLSAAPPPVASPAPDLVVASPGGVLPALGNEARRYGRDTLGLLTAPLSWDRRDREKAAAFAVILGGLFLADKSIDHQATESRSSTTDSVSSATTPFGAEGGFAVSAVLVAAGLAFHDPATRDMGRDALEAAVIAGLLDNAVKRISGRERPINSNGQTVFEPGSSNASFASGHTTVAFAVASVIAARSPGWVIPGIAYTAATLVAMDRINSRAHFASDVFAGAVLGTVTGRWLVHRHEAEAEGSRATVELVPEANGIDARIRF
ncbi:MAG TPA: phosphatase PAP2 family protein [Thermoanaerobaculia bacterium]|nr:phosphatase PAP2 family protein [Thermoanaerobaculia bacterium]